MNNKQDDQFLKEVYFYASVIMVPIGVLVNLKSFIINDVNRFKNKNIAFQ